MSKNIEYVQSEVVGSEIVETATDSSRLGDLITEAWAQQYARSTGLKVVPQPAVQVETEVVELKALLLALLRAVWKTTCRLFNGHSLGEVFSAAVISNKSVDDAYEWLLNRLTKSYLPTPSLPQPQDAPHLVENLQAGLGSRRMSGPNVPDGTSLLRMFANSSARRSVTEIVDDNIGWTWNTQSFSLTNNFLNAGSYPFSNVRRVVLGCSAVNYAIGEGLYNSYSNMKVYLAHLATVPSNLWRYSTSDDTQYPSTEGVPITNEYRSGGFSSGEIHLEAATKSALTEANNGAPFTSFKKIYLPAFERGYLRFGGSGAASHNPTTYILCGCKGDKTDTITLFCYSTVNTTITDIEIGEGACQNLTILNIEGLTAANIYSHILQRLKQDEADCGDGVTITLGATNLAKLEDEQHPEYASLLAELRTTYKYTFA